MPVYALLEGATLADAITNWTTLVNGVITIVEGNPIVFTMFAIPLVGGAIGLIKRLV